MQRRSGAKGKGDRLRVAVLMGGPSSEHEVSLQGGRNVIDALPPNLFEVRPVVISREGEWRLPPRGWKAPTGPGNGTAPAFDPHDLDGWRTHPGPCEALVALRDWAADVALPVLHGSFGEDGTLQACLAAAGIRYVGSDTAASAAAFDKVRAKEVFRFHGIETPAFEVVAAADLVRGRGERIDAWIDRYGLPLVLKNPRGGSTLEVRLAGDAGEAVTALDELVPPAERVMIEAHVAGRELTVGVLEERDPHHPTVLPVVEIRPRTASHFDYHEKYAADGAEEICPADLPAEIAEEAQALGLKVHRVLGLRGLSRTDMILTADGTLTVLEVNTLPGMTSRGLVPLAARAAGMEFPTLIANLVRTAHLPAVG